MHQDRGFCALLVFGVIRGPFKEQISQPLVVNNEITKSEDKNARTVPGVIDQAATANTSAAG
ncbi:hypothetical protein [Bacterioplanoides sp. SCSIO 12839]|uniref:hypothetical protein n=1 Tax=Bacterioplanoides sp. SCSIO 12839 TaxID=2829569 RepID=UPI002103DBB0|nr:hypothetical protein [Bacterioplanoides sp. SCSIO 12839]UTW50182.1 hypothetical protein KFF03_15600 [Bacterioplanoides sp. SCSIO 12839]